MLRRSSSLALVALVSLLAFAGCQKPPPPQNPDPEAAPAEDPNPIIPAEPANRSEGEVLEATIPVIGGESIELASLRGRPVLLEISASWEPGFAEAHALYAELLREHPQLAVIVVVADPADAGLEGLSDSFTLAWDPAGALAAKLTVATMPTMFVIDPAGTIHTVVNGWDDEVRAALVDAVTQVSGQVSGS